MAPSEPTRDIELLMQVTRSSDSRLSGTVRVADRAEPHPFSGTLELMRVFEELVPAAGVAAPAHDVASELLSAEPTPRPSTRRQ
jgi:hypothetical protein